MKSQRVIKEIVKTEKLPQGQTKVVPSRKSKNSLVSNTYTVKETTYEQRVKRSSYNTERSSNKSILNKSSNLKQGTNSGYIIQNKIPVSNKEENRTTIIKTTRSSRTNISDGYSNKRYTKREVDKIIKIQRWWRRILDILTGYKIRESLFSQNRNYVVKSQKIYTEKYISNKTKPLPQDLKSQNSKLYSSLNYTNSINQNSKSYTNINNVTSNMKRNLNNTNINTSSSQNYIQTTEKRVISQASPLIVQSGSTSPSVKSKYIIETKKVEVFKKPKNTTSSTQFVKETNSNTINSISNYEVKQLMRDIWSDETYCSTVESLCCLGDDGKSNVSQNTVLFEEYEEEIKKLKSIILQKDDELNNLVTNLKETKKELKKNITKNLKTKNGYTPKNLDQDAHELQIISTKLGWNDINIPSPVNEIYIESIENKIPPRMQYIEGMQIMGNEKIKNMEKWTQKIRTEESIQESVSDPEAVLEIQEMNALSIISNKLKPKNIYQHLQSLMILSKRNEEQSEEYSLKEKEEKTGIETIPVEKEPLIFQKIEQINIRSKPKPRKAKNQIQELDGLEIINYKRPKIDLKRKVKIKLITQNVDKINIKSLEPKQEKKNMIQELDGIEIIKARKEPHVPQCVDELEIMREYDMLLVKPSWNSLQIQGSGLNLLAMPRDMGLENQEVDEFEILGMEKPELYVQSLEQISYEKHNVLQKIQVLIPLPENNIDKLDNFKIRGIKKEPEVKIVEKIVEKKVAPNKIIQLDKFLIRGKSRSTYRKVLKQDTFIIKGREKVDNTQINMIEEIFIKGKEKKDNKRIIKLDKFQIKGKGKKVVINKIMKIDKIKLEGLEEEEKEVIEKEPEENIEENVVEFSIIRKQRKIGPNKIKKLERFRIAGTSKKVESNQIKKIDRFNISGIEREENKINNIDEFSYSAILKEANKIKILDRFRINGIRKKKVGPNQIKNTDRFRIIGVKNPKVEETSPKIRKGFVEKISKRESKKIEEKKEIIVEKKKPELFIDYIDDINISKAYSRKPSKDMTREFNYLNVGRRFTISLHGTPKKVTKVEPKTKIVEKIVQKDWNKIIRPYKTGKLIIKNDYERVQMPKQQLVEEYEEEEKETSDKRDKKDKPGKRIVEEEKTVEKVYIYQKPQEEKKTVTKNWNDQIKPIRTTKLNVKGIKKIVEKKEKIELDIENFDINIYDSGKKFRETLYIENSGFDLEGNKGMILKEGPAQTIKITKEQVLAPSKTFQFNLISKTPKKKVEKDETKKTVIKNWNDYIKPSQGKTVNIIQKAPKKDVVLKSVKENKLFIKGIIPKQVQQVVNVEKKKDTNWNDINTFRRESTFKILYRKKPSKEIKQVEKEEKVKTVEKIVEVEKKIDWNKLNKIQKKDKINLLHKKNAIILAKQRTNTMNLMGVKTDKNVQVVQKIQKAEKKDWTNILHAQRNAKFALYGKPKTKKYKLLVDNGDKLFIKRESEDDIIYNDDYNSRTIKQNLKSENEGERKKQILKEKEIIKEKEYVPRLQREIRAQISRLRESESETSSSISEIDVLAAIKKRKLVGYAAATGQAEADLLKYAKTGELNGYQTKVISGEVVFTAKNGLGVNLGEAQYQKQINNKVGYTKRITNVSGTKMSGIEINSNPRVKGEVYYQKLTGTRGTIADGNYKLIGTKEIVDGKGLLGDISCKQMRIVGNNSNRKISLSEIGNNNQQSYRKQVIITSKTENISQNDLNGQPITTKVILKSRTIDNNKNTGSRKRDSQRSGNSKKIKESSNSGSMLLRESSNINNNYDINQQMNAGKIVFNSRLKTENNQVGQYMTRFENEQSGVTTTKKEYEMRVKTTGNKDNEKIITQTKKVTEVKFKKGKRPKNIEPLRDYDS